MSPARCSTQAWAEITSQTQGLSRLLRQHAEDLNAGPLSKLGLLIRERQQLRKSYSEQWQQLQQDLTKVGGQLAWASACAHGEPEKGGVCTTAPGSRGSGSPDRRPALGHAPAWPRLPPRLDPGPLCAPPVTLLCAWERALCGARDLCLRPRPAALALGAGQ